MSLLVVLAAIVLLVLLIVKKISPMLALLAVSVVMGLFLGMPLPGVITAVNKGIGDTLAGTVMVLALGAFIGKLAEESGAAQKIVQVLVRAWGIKNIQWVMLCTGLLAGIPLFYNAGFVVLIPLAFAIASTTRLPMLYVGMPLTAALSVTHGFLPPHPGPVALAGYFHADIGTTLLYGLIIALPVAVVAGVLFPRLLLRYTSGYAAPPPPAKKDTAVLPSATKSFLIVLLPVVLITVGSAGAQLPLPGFIKPIFLFLQEPVLALLITVFFTLCVLPQPVSQQMETGAAGIRSVALIILIIAAGGAFKQVLIDSGVGVLIKEKTEVLHLSPLFLGWLIAALFRVTLGSATVAAVAAAGMMVPFLDSGVSPELLVLSVGAGSLFCSHVNDTGFWMFKEYFGLTLKQTFLSWTVMESIISLLGLAGVLLLSLVVLHH
jgi:gluconate transporter